MSTKPIKVAALSSILLIVMVSPSACADLTGYASIIRGVDKDLSAKHPHEALNKLEKLRKAYPKNPEVSALLMRTQCSLREYRRAQSLMSQVRGETGYPELAQAISRCHQEQAVSDSEAALQRGDAPAAIRLVSPFYPNGPDPYRAGLILARAYEAEHKPAKASALYRSLARRYPSDRGVSTQANKLQAELALSRARRQLTRGHAAKAIASAQPFYPNGPDPYRAGLILARAYEAEHKPAKASALYRSLARRYPSDRELSTQANKLQAELALSRARRQLTRGHAAKAIAGAQPFYPNGPDAYTAGLILAHAYAARRDLRAEATIYTSLAKKYPNDKGLMVAATVSNAEAGRAAAAKADLHRLNASQRHAVFLSLGPGINRLYGNFVTISGSAASSTSPYPADHTFGIQEGTATAVGTFVASLQQTHRFAQTANMYGLNYYTSLGSGYSGEASFDYSPPNAILAREAIGLSLARSFGSLSLIGSVRHLVYSHTVANVLFGGIGTYPSAAFHVEAGVYYVPVVKTYSVLVAPEWFHGEGNRTYLYLTDGETGEQLLGNSAILRTHGYSMTLGETFQITHKTYLNTDVFYEHRSGLYDRRGIYVALTRRW